MRRRMLNFLLSAGFSYKAYRVYFVVGLMSGSIVTTLDSLTGALWFPIFGGVVLGLCAALLWTGCGYIAFCRGGEAELAGKLHNPSDHVAS
ncbi:hypothetical protein B0J14DRAFT_611527 [Halenospora varia]|nr:hypothetical protein B0J14DRAFT_611527 [Halenospora varia]